MTMMQKKHEAPLFEVIMNQEANRKFFVASGEVDPSPRAFFHVDSWSQGW